MVYTKHKSPLDFVVSAQSNEKGAKGGSKITTEKHNPLESPFAKGDLKRIT